jgi:WD40 repeat protein
VVKGEPRRLVAEPYSGFDYTEISPDNSEVLYGARKAGLDGAVYVVSSSGGESRKLADPGIGARWRPDGQLIGYIRDGSPGAPSQSGKFEFWTVKPDGSENRLMFVDSLCYRWWNYCFDWSPRGDQIAWLRSSPGYGEIFVRELKTGRERQLTHYKKPITEMAWASNGQIFFTSSRSGNTNVWMIPARGGEAVQVTKGSGPDYAVRVSADARRLLYVEQLRIINLWTADIDGSGARQLTFDNQYLSDPGFSPDKNRISFTVNSSDQLRPGAHVFVMHADGTKRAQITHGDGSYSHPSWSPDGKYMTYGSRAANEPSDSSRVYLIDASDPGTPRLVGRGAGAVWVSHENFVSTSAFPHPHSTLYSLTTDEPIEVSPDSSLRFPLPDGVHSVTWDMRTGHAGWWLETPGKGDDGAPRQILSSDYCFRAAVSASLRYLVYQESDGKLWRMSLPDGKRERLPPIFDGINPLMWSDIQFSLDDKSVVYGRTRLEAKLVLVENLFK